MHYVSWYIFPEILSGCKFYYSAIKPARKQQKCMIMAYNNLDKNFIHVMQSCTKDGQLVVFCLLVDFEALSITQFITQSPAVLE